MRLKRGVKSDSQVEREVRSAFRLEVLISCVPDDDDDDDDGFGCGIAGSTISVRRMLWTAGSERRVEASACPMNPAAPVMRTWSLSCCCEAIPILPFLCSCKDLAMCKQLSREKGFQRRRTN